MQGEDKQNLSEDKHKNNLSELEQIRSRFFANISHEFRTPLTLILAPLETLLSAADPESKEHGLLLTMQRNARRLLNLINQLLDLSKLEAGSLQLETAPGDVLEHLRSLAACFAPLAETRQIHFTYHIPKSAWVCRFDSDKIEKIVVNLLSNACKFTQDGGSIHLQATVDKEEKQDKLVIIVTDDGIGIAEQQLEKIFDRFYGSEDSQLRQKEGTGIGLALAKELVELHGGHILAESSPGNGTVFTVELPLQTVTEPAGTSQTNLPLYPKPTIINAIATGQAHHLDRRLEEALPANGQITPSGEEKPFVLIVEDNAELSSFITMQFDAQYQVIEAPDGEAGWLKALEHVPDIIISDVMMPKMSGIELSQKLKADERTSHIPLILLTAKAARENKLDGLQAGADDYLTKPFCTVELLVRVRNLLEGRKKLRERYSRQITIQPSQISVTSADERFLKRVIGIINKHIDASDFTAEAFEREVGLSHVQLYRKMKSLTNQAPGEFLRNYRLQQAAMLLKGKHGTVSEVAYTVGFTNLAHFTRCFKSLYGQTPSQYLAVPAMP